MIVVVDIALILLSFATPRIVQYLSGAVHQRQALVWRLCLQLSATARQLDLSDFIFPD
jgi:hypothetical protein